MRSSTAWVSVTALSSPRAKLPGRFFDGEFMQFHGSSFIFSGRYADHLFVIPAQRGCFVIAKGTFLVPSCRTPIRHPALWQIEKKLDSGSSPE
jgi:hypothetical protein